MPIVGDAYALEEVEKIPNDLPSAVALLDQSPDGTGELLGDEFVNFYAENGAVGGRPASVGQSPLGS